MAYDFMKNFENNEKSFKRIINNYFNTGTKSDQKIVLGECPPVFELAGANPLLNLVIDYETIDHIMFKHFVKGKEKLKLEKDDILSVYKSLVNPVCLIDGNAKNSFIVITEQTNKNGYNIQIPIYINQKSGFLNVNEIATEYSNERICEYVYKEILKHNVLSCNNKKLENLLHSIGLLLPKENISISSYNDSIVHNTENVKYSEVNFNKNIYYKFDTDNKYFKPTFKANYIELEKACKELNLSSATNYFYVPDMNVKKETYEFTGIEQYYKEELSKIRNKVIENKTKEIEVKLNEVKNMIKNETSNGTQYDIDDINKGFDKLVEEIEEKKLDTKENIKNSCTKYLETKVENDYKKEEKNKIISKKFNNSNTAI